jgi:hypothetical protein
MGLGWFRHPLLGSLMFVKFEVQEACEVFDAGKGIQPKYVG